MLRRSSAALVAGAAVVLTGCGLTTPIATQIPYNPGDGVRVVLNDDVRVENLLLLTPAEGEEALLVGMVVNDAHDETNEVTIASEEGEVYSGELEARSTYNLNDEPRVIAAVETLPGSTVPLTLSTAGISISYEVPVLDGTLPEYEAYIEDHAEAFAEATTGSEDPAAGTETDTATSTETDTATGTETDTATGTETDTETAEGSN